MTDAASGEEEPGARVYESAASFKSDLRKRFDLPVSRNEKRRRDDGETENNMQTLPDWS